MTLLSAVKCDHECNLVVARGVAKLFLILEHAIFITHYSYRHASSCMRLLIVVVWKCVALVIAKLV